MMRSAKVDLPWSMCAMMEKLRICCIESKIKIPPEPAFSRSAQYFKGTDSSRFRRDTQDCDYFSSSLIATYEALSPLRTNNATLRPLGTCLSSSFNCANERICTLPIDLSLIHISEPT